MHPYRLNMIHFLLAHYQSGNLTLLAGPHEPLACHLINLVVPPELLPGQKHNAAHEAVDELAGTFAEVGLNLKVIDAMGYTEVVIIDVLQNSYSVRYEKTPSPMIAADPNWLHH